MILDHESPQAQREHRIIAVIMALGEGEITTYGDIAATAGYPRQARLVGRLLQTFEPSPDATDGGDGDMELPWWRVVNASGRLVPGNEVEHAALLRSEGVTVHAGRVVDAPVGRFRRSPRTRS